jgi:hypothetical protein
VSACRWGREAKATRRARERRGREFATQTDQWAHGDVGVLSSPCVAEAHHRRPAVDALPLPLATDVPPPERKKGEGVVGWDWGGGSQMRGGRLISRVGVFC